MGRKNYASREMARKLRKTVKFIADGGYRFDMKNGLTIPAKRVGYEGDVRLRECGTAMCFAGAWVLMNAPAGLSPRKLVDHLGTALFEIEDDGKVLEYGWDEVHERAEKGLGLDHTEADLLFLMDSWPWEYQRAYIVAPKARRVEVLKERVEHFIRTGE